MFPLIIAVFLVLIIGTACVMEYLRLTTIVTSVKTSYQSIMYDLTLDNNINIYTSLRDGYSGAYTYDEIARIWNEKYQINGDIIEEDLNRELGMVRESNGTWYAKYDGGGTVLYRLGEIESNVTNTDLAPGADNEAVLTITHTFQLEITLNGIWRSLGPLNLTIEQESEAMPLF